MTGEDNRLDRRTFIAGSLAAGLGATAYRVRVAHAAGGMDSLPQTMIEAAKKEGELVPYEPFPTEQSKPMADNFTEHFGIPNKFFRAGQEALQARVEAELRAGKPLADVLGQSDLDIVADMIDRGVIETQIRSSLWDEYPEEWRYPKLNNIAYAILSCNIIYNNQLVKEADAPKGWEDLVAAKWKGQVVIPSPEYAGTGFALLAEWVKRYGWDFIRALKANNVFVVQAVSDSDRRVISGQKLVGIVNSHRASALLGQKAPITLLWPKKTPPVAMSYVHAIFKEAPHPNAAHLFRDYVLTPEVQSLQAKVGLWSAHPKAAQPENIPHFKDVTLAHLDYDDIRKNRQKLLQGWREIMRG